jgi:hypothetical protein
MTHSSNLKMRAIYYSETLDDFQRTTRRHIQTIKFITSTERTSNHMGSLKVCDSFFY